MPFLALASSSTPASHQDRIRRLTRSRRQISSAISFESPCIEDLCDSQANQQGSRKRLSVYAASRTSQLRKSSSARNQLINNLSQTFAAHHSLRAHVILFDCLPPCLIISLTSADVETPPSRERWILMSKVSTTVEAAIAAPRTAFYAWLVPGVFSNQLETVLRDAASLPGVEKTTGTTGRWDAAGSTRIVHLTDGTSCRETVQESTAPDDLSVLSHRVLQSARRCARQRGGRSVVVHRRRGAALMRNGPILRKARTILAMSGAHSHH